LKRHRSSFILLTLSLTAALGALPGSALAGSLLSGYGGPGGGTQALLGSTLVNGSGPSAGSSGGSSSGAGSSAGGGGVASVNGSAPAPGSASSGRGSGAAGASTSRGHGGGLERAKGASGTSAGGSAAYTSAQGPRPVAATPAARDAEQSPLGFTGTDALLLAFVLGVLAMTMALTRGLARMQQNF
jgi:hypothetical protein